MNKRIRKKRSKRIWYLSLGASKCKRVFRPEVVNGKLRRAALSGLKFDRPSETNPEVFESDLIPVRFFFCG